MTKKKQIIEKEIEKNISDLLIGAKLKWFTDTMKKNGLYTEKWGKAYEIYLKDRISEDKKEMRKAFDNYDLHEILIELVNFCKWWDEMYDTEDEEVLIFREV